MEPSIDAMLRHFNGVNAANISQFGLALSNGNWNDLRAINTRVAGMSATVSITSFLNSSREGLRQFVAKAEREFDPEALKFLFGGVLSGVGGAALAEAAGLAAAIGVSIVAVEVIAVVLLLWGLSLTLPAIWKRAMAKIGELKEQLGSEPR